ncbi:hypothetical protein B0H13DRAFT_1857466 [Mycena leptocephala]|nr:hypothetical protein B0H13DRAFT_1857466 [Mycena leptocephala]
MRVREIYKISTECAHHSRGSITQDAGYLGLHRLGLPPVIVARIGQMSLLVAGYARRWYNLAGGQLCHADLGATLVPLRLSASIFLFAVTGIFGTTTFTKEAREPRFPMEIGDRTFQLVEEHLNALDYHGRLFGWGCRGPIRVADPDAIKAVLEDANVRKATKVRVWCLSVPLPGITPLVVAAMPIPNDMTAKDLLVPLEKILYGLLNRKIRVVSYASDGTEVERSLQQILLDKADRKITHTISNPIPGGKDFVLLIWVFKDFPIVMLQDSKHALKTFRNNLFTGARRTYVNPEVYESIP